MSVEGGTIRLSVGRQQRGQGNHDNRVRAHHHHQGTVTLIEISGEQVSWASPILTNTYPKGGRGREQEGSRT